MRCVLLAAVLAAAAACGTPAKPHNRTPEMQEKYRAAVERGEVKLGMTRSEVAEAVGKPQRKDRTKYGRREVERWHYTFSEVYFDDEGYVVGFRSAGY